MLENLFDQPVSNSMMMVGIVVFSLCTWCLLWSMERESKKTLSFNETP